MELICPICNGLEEYSIRCNKCKEVMKDMGRITDYYDDYSAYLEMSITDLVDGAPSNECVHLYTCKNCHNDRRIQIDKVIK